MNTINILVCGESKFKFLNRLCNGNYDDICRDFSTKIYTDCGIFELKFITNESDMADYAILINEENSPVELNRNIRKLICNNYREVEYGENNNISIRCNYKITFPVMQIIREISGNLNINEIEGPAVAPPEATISENDLKRYEEILGTA